MKNLHLPILILFLIKLTPISSQSNHFNMSLIPGGEFMMGKDSKNESDFSPAHKVKLDSFYIDRNEVSNKEYAEFCKATGHHLPEFWNVKGFQCGDDFLDYPVIGVNWMDANKYAIWTGRRLPTEAEWEYAARGGLKEKEYPNGNKWNKLRAKNEAGKWINLIDPVGSFIANAYGLYDMGGNVWEWVQDGYDEMYYRESEIKNPPGPLNKTNRVIRGGSWHSGAMCKKVYFRKGLPLNWCDFAVGFRCVKDLE